MLRFCATTSHRSHPPVVAIGMEGGQSQNRADSYMLCSEAVVK